MSERWMVLHEGQSHGPYSPEDLKRLLDGAIFPRDACARREGEVDSYLLGDILSGDLPAPRLPAGRLVQRSRGIDPGQISDCRPVAKGEIDSSADAPNNADSQQSSRASAKPPGVLTLVGVHPLVAIGVFALDLMIFPEEVATFGLSILFLSIPAACLVVIAATLVQRYGCRDGWALAFGKALLMALLVAIPTPIPGFFALALGIPGYMNQKSLHSSSEK